MTFRPGDRVFLTRQHGPHLRGSEGSVVYVERRWLRPSRYTVLLDDSSVVEGLTAQDILEVDAE